MAFKPLFGAPPSAFVHGWMAGEARRDPHPQAAVFSSLCNTGNVATGFVGRAAVFPDPPACVELNEDSHAAGWQALCRRQ